VVARRGHGCVLAYAVGTDGPTLAAIRTGTHGLETMFRVPVPREITLAHDPASRRAFAVWQAASGTHVRELGDEPPSFGTIREREPFPGVAPQFLCERTAPGIFAHVTESAQAGRWDDVRAQLEAIDVATVPADHRAHHHHLLGLAFARLGAPERAREIWDAGIPYDEPERPLSCQLPTCMEIVEDLDPSAAENESLIKQVRRAIVAFSVCASRGDTHGALAALRAGSVHRLRERQSLARLAEAWLALPDDHDGALWFDKAQALAQFLDVADDSERDLPIPGAWDDARMAGIAVRARAWLSGHGHAAQ